MIDLRGYGAAESPVAPQADTGRARAQRGKAITSSKAKQRIAEALRENLRRRKAQERGRRAAAEMPEELPD
jgi:hypothetical protein